VKLLGLLCTALTFCAATSGCMSLHHEKVLVDPDVPRELDKINLPDYVLEPPDLLVINALRVIPKPPYLIEPGDALFLQYTGEIFPNKPLEGVYTVEPDGVINLGPSYGGTVKVSDLTLDKAREAVQKHLEKILKPGAGPKLGVVSISLAQSRGFQQIRGEHLVRPDGTVSLGAYGKVLVTGLTLDEAKLAIEEQLSKFLAKPEVALDVVGYNSKVFYIIIDQGGGTEQVIRLPVYGSETVLDAIAQINGLPLDVSRKRIWVARPSLGHDDDDILPVNWTSVTRGGKADTNYQVLPGDRIYIAPDPVVRFDHVLAKLLLPVERALGITLLGATTVTAVKVANAPVNSTGSGIGTGR
jgi:polysaccharide export outer membrane protein